MKSLPFDVIVKVAARAPWLFVGIMVEVGLTMAVLVNVAAVVSDHLALLQTPSGVSESNIAVIQSLQTDLGSKKGNFQQSLEALRQTPGVEAAAMGDVPLWNVRKAPVGLRSDGSGATVDSYAFTGSQGLGNVLALRYVSGRPISDLEIPDASTLGPGSVFPVVLTQSLASRLFGGSSPLGQTVYFGSQSARVVGVVDHLRGAISGDDHDDLAFMTEYRLGAQDMGGGFLIRADAAHLHRTLEAASAALRRANPNHVQQLVQTMDDLRADYFRDRTATAWLLLGVAAILVLITVGGVVGLGTYWVHQRRGEIGIRRALGASRRDILLYFQLENLMVMSAGVLLGAVTALSLSAYLSDHYGVPPINGPVTVIAVIALTLLGQTASFWPAYRASRVSPASAINGA